VLLSILLPTAALNYTLYFAVHYTLFSTTLISPLINHDSRYTVVYHIALRHNNTITNLLSYEFSVPIDNLMRWNAIKTMKECYTGMMLIGERQLLRCQISRSLFTLSILSLHSPRFFPPFFLCLYYDTHCTPHLT
jgi:hypothetical protein